MNSDYFLIGIAIYFSFCLIRGLGFALRYDCISDFSKYDLEWIDVILFPSFLVFIILSFLNSPVFKINSKDDF